MPIKVCIALLSIFLSYSSIPFQNMTIESLLELRKLNLDALMQKYELQASDIYDYEVSYQKLNGLREVNNSALPGTFYYANDTVALIYIGEGTISESLSAKMVFDTYGKKDILKSRAAKTSNLYVYPKEGFAISVSNNKEIEFLEIFPPMPIEDYQKNIYKEVNFIR